MLPAGKLPSSAPDGRAQEAAGAGGAAPANGRVEKEEQRLDDHEAGQEEEDDLLKDEAAGREIDGPRRIDRPDAVMDGDRVGGGEIERRGCDGADEDTAA